MTNYRSIVLDALHKAVCEHGYADSVQNRDIHEQALSHRLAVHLELSGYFVGYHVDCEYNRFEQETKRDAAGDLFRPDIIVHIRGEQSGNLIMIECKKFNDRGDEIEEVREQLAANKDLYNYAYAFVVIFPEHEETMSNESVIEV